MDVVVILENMNNWIKLVFIIAATYYGVQYMGTTGDSGGGDMPKSLLSLVRQAKAQDKKVVILITGSDWCGACKKMEQGMLGTAQWLGFAGKDVVFQKFEYPNGGQASTQAHKDLLELPGFEGFPTLLVADGKGKILGIRAGYGGGADEYIDWIKSL
jgi:thiol:disulfide interchange protein